jgi:hypothetical protein
MNKCIVTLANSRRISELNGLISNLNTYFVKNNNDVDLIIFHENSDNITRENIERYTGGNTICHNIEDFILDDSPFNKEVPEYVYGFPISYRKMCQFFSGEIFKILKNMNYDYYIRLDTDSRFLDITYDIFSDFILHDYYYGYISILNEPPELCIQLVNEMSKYIYTNNIHHQNHILSDHKDQLNFVYYNNFEVVKISEFTCDLHLKMYNHLNTDINGFLKYRWGDALFRFIYVSLFFQQSKIKYYANLDYWHNGSFKNVPFMFNNYHLPDFRKNVLNLKSSMSK